jgi:hypothetical protein
MPETRGADNFAVWGHSQGGQAALFTGLIAASYAPELKLVGVAAAAPATELATLLNDDINSFGGRNLTAMTLWSWSRVFGAPISRLVDPSAVLVVDRLAEECIAHPLDGGADRRKVDRDLVCKALVRHRRFANDRSRSLPCQGSEPMLQPLRA